MIGRVYLKIAKDYVEQRPNALKYLSDDSKNSILESRDYNKISALIGNGITNDIAVAIDKITEVFGLVGNKEEYLNFVLHGGEYPYVYINKTVNEKNFSFLVIQTLINTHDEWVVERAEDFFNPTWSEKIFLFSPLPCLGWKTLALHLVFLQPIIEDLFGKGEDDEAAYKAAYWQSVAEFQAKLHSKMGVPTLEDWSVAISNGLKDGTFYPVLPKKIANALLEDDKLRMRYAEQIILHLQEA